MVKKITIFLSLFFCCVTFLHSKDITIRINGEEYIRKEPKSLEEAKELIEYLTKINNNADDALVDLKTKYDEMMKDHTVTINKLNDIITSLNEKSKEMGPKTDYIEKELDKRLKVKTFITPYFDYNVFFDYPRMSVGHMIGASVNFRFLRNVNFKLNLNGIIYTNIGAFVPGIGFSIGYSIF